MPQPTEKAVEVAGSNHRDCCPPSTTAKVVHSFSKIIAQEHGVAAALIASYLANRIQHTKVNGKRKPYRANLDKLHKHYPYLSRSTIGNALNCLVDSGILIRSNTNRRSYDRTGSYSFSNPDNIQGSRTKPIYFEVSEAKAYGINAAIVLQNLRFWLSKADAPQYHPLSPATLSEHLPFLSEDQIKAAIKRLLANCVIIANPDIPKNRTQEYRLHDETSGGEFLDKSELSGGEVLDERGGILDIRGDFMDDRGEFLDSNRLLVDDIGSQTLKEDCFKVSASETPTINAAILPFAKPIYLTSVVSPHSGTPKPQAVVPDTAKQQTSTPRHHKVAPPLPCCDPSPMTESLPATYAEASKEYSAFIQEFSQEELLDAQDTLLHNYAPFIATADKKWIDTLFVPRTREDLYQHLKAKADQGLPKSLTTEERNDHTMMRPYRIFSLIYLVTAFSYCHWDSNVKMEHHTCVTYDLTLAISKIFEYRMQVGEEQLKQRYQAALEQLEQNRQKHTNDEEDNYFDPHLSPAVKAKVLKHFIDQHNAIGYIDRHAQIQSGTMKHTDWDLQAAAIFFEVNSDLSAGDIGNLMVACMVMSKGYKNSKQGCPDLIADGTKLGHVLLRLARIAAELGANNKMPPFKTLTFEELFPQYVPKRKTNS